MLDQLGALQVGEHVDGALEEFQPGAFSRLAVELLARKKISLVVVATAGAADAGEAVQPADHVAALGRADQHRQGFTGVVEQQTLAFHGADGYGVIEPGREGAAPGAGGHHHRVAVDVAGGGLDSGHGGTIGDEAGDLAVKDLRILAFCATGQPQVESVAVQLGGLVLVHRADDGVRRGAVRWIWTSWASIQRILT